MKVLPGEAHACYSCVVLSRSSDACEAFCQLAGRLPTRREAPDTQLRRPTDEKCFFFLFSRSLEKRNSIKSSTCRPDIFPGRKLFLIELTFKKGIDLK